MAAISLAGSGVKNFKLIDADIIEESNLNRQFLYTKKDIGRYKADVLAEAINSRYTTDNLITQKEFINTENLVGLINNVDFILITADEPFGIADSIFKLAEGKIDTINCSYINSMASFVFKPKNIIDKDCIYKEPIYDINTNRIVPSIGPINLELAGLASLQVMLSLAELTNNDPVIKGIWNANILPRMWSI